MNIILDKARDEKNLELVQWVHYQIAEFFILYQYDWNLAKAHLREIFALPLFDDRAVAKSAKDAMTNVFSAMQAIFMRDDLDEDEIHLMMIETISEMIFLSLEHPGRSLGLLDFQLICDR